MREAELSMSGALAHSEESTCSPCRPILRVRMCNLDGLMKPCGCDKTYTLDGLKLWARSMRQTLREANNYAISLSKLQRYEEAKSLLRKTIPVARRVLGRES